MAGLIAVSGAVALVGIPPDREDYLAVIVPKIQRLKATASPKLVFVGGSNLAFGLDSRAVEDALAYPVVNMGMGFNMGLRFMLDVVQPNIGKGDVVVMVPEYNLFYGLLDGDERLLDVLELYPEGWQFIRSRQQIYKLADNLFRHVKFKVNRVLQQVGHTPDPACIYCPQAFNEYGDIVAHLDKPPKDVGHMKFLQSANRQVDVEAIETINRFARAVKSRGARVVLLFPCIPTPHYEQRRAAIDRLYAVLREKLEVDILSTPGDYVYPLSYFYDWVYHLNREGRALRTAQVIQNLRSTLETARREATGPTPTEATGPTSRRHYLSVTEARAQ